MNYTKINIIRRFLYKSLFYNPFFDNFSDWEGRQRVSLDFNRFWFSKIPNLIFDNKWIHHSR